MYLSEAESRSADRHSPTHVSADVEKLHRRCGIYTDSAVVGNLLDAIGWTADADLASARLLEPAAGDGAFLVEVAERLAAALRNDGHELTLPLVRDRVLAFELHPIEAARARENVAAALARLGVQPTTAWACAAAWIRTGDFLLASDLPEFTHVIGNPPYVRWSKIPKRLRSKYEPNLPSWMTGGDLFVPFLDRSLAALVEGGRFAFVCTDRLRHMNFAAGFRSKWAGSLDESHDVPLNAREAFQRDVGAYPILWTGTRRPPRGMLAVPAVIEPGATLTDLGCFIRVGPALGYTPAYVLEPDETDVEDELLLPWFGPREIEDGVVRWAGNRIVAMHDEAGELRNIDCFPLLRARLVRAERMLRKRSVVKKGRVWYAPIDRVRGTDWAPAKIVLPELAKRPRCALDYSGAVPSHGAYAIFPPAGREEEVLARLANGRLAAALEKVAPRVGGEYLRCYKSILLKIRV